MTDARSNQSLSNLQLGKSRDKRGCISSDIAVAYTPTFDQNLQESNLTKRSNNDQMSQERLYVKDSKSFREEVYSPMSNYTDHKLHKMDGSLTKGHKSPRTAQINVKKVTDFRLRNMKLNMLRKLI